MWKLGFAGAPEHSLSSRIRFPEMPHAFEDQASSLSLAEGLAEYYAQNPSLKRSGDLSPEARRFFHSHDVVHVLYGCGTTMPDEAIVKLASLCGTTGGVSILKGYLHHESLDIYRKLPLADTLLALLMAPWLIARTVWRCALQVRRWPWASHAPHLHTPLHELRAEYGIKVAHGRPRDAG
ncbi:MAG: hypothetical protein ABIO45_06585 [Burkholderiaceae bacterium]